MLAGGFNLNISIRGILNPSADVEFIGFVGDEIPEPDSLNTAANSYVNRFHPQSGVDFASLIKNGYNFGLSECPDRIDADSGSKREAE